jgi:hypothetical protein
MPRRRGPHREDEGEDGSASYEALPPPDPQGPHHRDYQIALGLILGQSPKELADAHDVELTYVLTSPKVTAAEKRLQHLHRYGAPAAKGVLLDALPGVLNALIAVAGDPGHRAWSIAAKLYLDRVMPVIEMSHTHHTHAVDIQSKQAIASASQSLATLVEQLAPKVLGITAGRDIESRVLRGEAAKPTTITLPDVGQKNER